MKSEMKIQKVNFKNFWEHHLEALKQTDKYQLCGIQQLSNVLYIAHPVLTMPFEVQTNSTTQNRDVVFRNILFRTSKGGQCQRKND